MPSHAVTTNRSTQAAATVVAATFLLVGILGFVPGITTDYDLMKFAGHDSQAQLLGIFQVSVLHNLVHGLFGIVGLLMARAAATAKTFPMGGGVVYIVLWLYGLLVSAESSANFVPLDTADNRLHLVLGVAMIVMGLALGRRATVTTTT